MTELLARLLLPNPKPIPAGPGIHFPRNCPSHPQRVCTCRAFPGLHRVAASLVLHHCAFVLQFLCTCAARQPNLTFFRAKRSLKRREVRVGPMDTQTLDSEAYDREIALFLGNPMVVSEQYFACLSDSDIRALGSGPDSASDGSDLIRMVTHVQQVENLEALLPTGGGRFLRPANSYGPWGDRERTVFEAFYAKRVAVLRHLLRINGQQMEYTKRAKLHRTALAERAASGDSKVTLTPSRAAVKPGADGVPPIVRFGLLSIFPLIEAVGAQSPALRSNVLGVLETVLKTSPPLSLVNEPESTWTSIKTLLVSQDNPARAASVRIGLAIHRGSLRHILSALVPAVRDAALSRSLDVAAYVGSIAAAHTRAPAMSTLGETGAGEGSAAWPHQEPFATLPHRPDSEDAAWRGSAAGTRAFTYVHGPRGLLKIGTGACGSIRGQIYAHNASAQPGEEGWLAFARGFVYFRAAGDITRLATRYCARTLKALGPLVVPSAADAAESRDYCHMTGDGAGRLLFMRVPRDNSSSGFGVDVFAPDGGIATRVRSVGLPRGWTQFPTARRSDKNPDERKALYHYYVGQRVDAKDSVNKWCPAVVRQVTASRVLIHYEGWSKKWDEWFEIDSSRLDAFGAHTQGARSHGGGKAAADARWSFFNPETAQPDSAADSKGDATRDGDSWTAFGPTVSQRIESAYQRGTSQLFTVRAMQKNLVVDLNQMIMSDPATDTELRLRRSDTHTANALAFTEDVQVYSTPAQLVAVLPPRCPPNMGSEAVLRVFSMEDGSWIGDKRLRLGRISGAFYEPEGDALWTYVAPTREFRQFDNPGPAKCPSRDGDTASAGGAAMVLRELSARARALPAPTTTTRPGAHEPFCVDVHEDTFSRLGSLLAVFQPGADGKTATVGAEAMVATCHILDILEVNLARISAADTAALGRIGETKSILESMLNKQDPGLEPVRNRAVRCLAAGASWFFPSAQRVRDAILSRVKASVASSAVSRVGECLLDRLAESPQLITLLDDSQAFMASVRALVASVRDAELRDIGAIGSEITRGSSDDRDFLVLSPALRVMTRIQLHFLTVVSAGPQKDSTSAGLGAFSQYVSAVVGASVAVLERAAAVLGCCSDIARQHILARTQSGMAGTLLPSLVAFIGSRPEAASGDAARTTLRQLVAVLDRYNARAGCRASEFEFAFDSARSEAQTRVVESPHPYTKGTIDRSVHIPGAVCMSIEFDELCSSKNSNDALKISRSFPRWQHVAYGSPSSRAHGNPWLTGRQRRLLRVRGDTLNFYWNVDKEDKKHKQNNWGFRCVVRGYVPNCRSLPECAAAPTAPLLPWSADLELCVALSLGRMSCDALAPLPRAMPTIGGTSSRDVDQLVDLNLFAGRTSPETAVSKGEAVVALASGRVPKIAETLIAMLARRAGQRPQMSRTMLESVRPCECKIIASLLRHAHAETRFGDALAAVTAGGEAPQDQVLESVWTAAHGVLAWILRESQVQKEWDAMNNAVRAAIEANADGGSGAGGDTKAPPTPEGGTIRDSIAKIADSELRAVSAGLRTQLCESQGFGALQGDVAIRTLKGRLQDIASAPQPTGQQGSAAVPTQTPLARIAARVAAVAELLFSAGPGSDAEVPPFARIRRLFECAGRGLITAPAIRALLSSRTRSAQNRARAYSSVADALSAVTVSPIQLTLLKPVPCVYYADGLAGCPEPDLVELRKQFGKFMTAVMKALQPLPTRVAHHILMHRIGLQFLALPFRPCDAGILAEARAPSAALRVAAAAYGSRRFVYTPGMCGKECLSATTGSNFVQMGVYECKDCGLTDGKLCCYVCAKTCHKGHRVTFKKNSKAFCDCGFSSSCKAMHEQRTVEKRERQVVLARLALIVLRSMATRVAGWGAAGAALRASVAAEILTATEAQYRAFTACDPKSEASCESYLRDLIRVGFLFMRRASTEGVDLGASPRIMQRHFNVLLSITNRGSLSTQRLAIRCILLLLECLKPDALPKNSARRSIKDLLAIVGTAALASSIAPSAGTGVSVPPELKKREVKTRPSLDAKGFSAVSATPTVTDGSVDTAPPGHRLLLWLPDGTQPDEYAQRFVASFLTQLNQFTERSDTAERAIRRLKLGLERSGKVVLMVGPRERCLEFGGRVARQGLQSSVEPCQPDAVASRNRVLCTNLRAQNFMMSGRQAVERAAQLVEALQSLLHRPRCADWAEILREVLAAQVTVAADPRAVSAAGALAPCMGALCVVSGFLCRVMRIGGRVGVRAGGNQQPGASTSTGGAPILQANSQFGTVVSLEPGYNQMRVVFDDDERRRPTLVHRSKLHTAQIFQDGDMAVALGARAGGVTESLLDAAEWVFQDDMDTTMRLHADSLGPLILGSIRVLLAARPTDTTTPAALACLRRHALLEVVRDRVAGDFRTANRSTLQQQTARALSRLFDLRGHPAKLLRRAGGSDARRAILAKALCLSDDAQTADAAANAARSRRELPYALGASGDATTAAMPTRWSRTSAPHCMFCDDSQRAVQYAGGHSKRTKSKNGDGYPVTVSTDAPVPQGAAAHYFEVTILRAGAPPNARCSSQLDQSVGGKSGDGKTEDKDAPAPGSTRRVMSIGLCPTDNASSLYHAHGWCAGSMVYVAHTGDKAVFHPRAVDVAYPPRDDDGMSSSGDRKGLRVDDLVDARDSVAKWEAARIIAVSTRQVRVHYIHWDSRYDEWMDRGTDRIARFRTHTVGSAGQLFPSAYGVPAREGDVVGCLFDRRRGEVSFTLNGRSLGVAFQDVHAMKTWYPSVTLYDSRVQAVVNLGQTPFAYNLAADARLAETMAATAVSPAPAVATSTPPASAASPQPQSPSRLKANRERYQAARAVLKAGILPECSIQQLVRALELNGDDTARMVEWAFAHPFEFFNLGRGGASSGEAIATRETGPRTPAPPPPDTKRTGVVEKRLARMQRRRDGSDIDIESWFDSDDEGAEERPPSTVTGDASDTSTTELAQPALPQVQSSFGMDSDTRGAWTAGGGGPRAELEEAEAARSAAQASSVDAWLSQLEHGLGSAQLERVHHVLQQLRRFNLGSFNFGSFAHAIMALPHLRAGGSQQGQSSVVVIGAPAREGPDARGASSGPGRRGSDAFYSDEATLWSPTAIAGRQAVVQEQLGPVEQALTGARVAVGLRVRVSASAKKDTLSSDASQRGGLFEPDRSPWLPEMDASEGCIGVIRAVDADQSGTLDDAPDGGGPCLALIEIWDQERSMMTLWWYHTKHLLARPASCQDAYLGLSTYADAKSALESARGALTAHSARAILARLSPYLIHNRMLSQELRPPGRLWQAAVGDQGNSPKPTRALLDLCVLPKPLPCPVLHKLLKEAVRAASQRLLTFDTILCTPPMRPRALAPAGVAPGEASRHIDDYLPALQALVMRQPMWFVTLLRGATALLRRSSRLFCVEAKISAACTRAGAAGVVWSESFSAPKADFLMVSFGRDTRVPAGALLAFYSNAECTQLVRCVSVGSARGATGSTGAASGGVQPGSFVVPGGRVWVRCMASARAAEGGASRAPSSDTVSARITINPISSGLPLACWIVHHVVDAYARVAARRETEKDTLSGFSLAAAPDVQKRVRVQALEAQLSALAVALTAAHTECFALMTEPNCPAGLQVVIARALTRVLRVAPRGLFGDLREFEVCYSALRKVFEAEMRGVGPRSKPSGSKCAVHSEYLQCFAQLLVATRLHFDPAREWLDIGIGFDTMPGVPDPGPPLEMPMSVRMKTGSIKAPTAASSFDEIKRSQERAVSNPLAVCPFDWTWASRLGSGDMGKVSWLDAMYYLSLNCHSLCLRSRDQRVNRSWSFPLSVVRARVEAEDVKAKAHDQKAAERRSAVCLSSAEYAALARYLQRVAEMDNASPLRMGVRHDEAVLSQMPAEDRAILARINPDVLVQQGAHIQSLSHVFEQCATKIDLSAFAVRAPWTLGHQLLRCKDVLLTSVKMRVVDSVIAATASSGRDIPTVRINRIIASDQIDPSRGAQAQMPAAASPNARSGPAATREDARKQLSDVHSLAGDTIFGQAFRQIGSVAASRLRPPQPRGASPHVSINVIFEGEHVLGQAGPYRAFFSDICRELQESQSPEDPYPLGLFMPTPNNQHRIGEDRDRFMPHPSKNSVQHLELYEFVGRLMGIAMRTRIIMALDLASLVWKQLTRTPLTLGDLRRVDAALVKNVLEPLIPSSKAALDRKGFARQFGRDVTVTLTKSDQSPLRVGRAGPSPAQTTPELKSMKVGFDDREKLVSLLVRARLGETRQQVDAMRRGLTQIVPGPLLTLLTWKELETRICGSRDIDIELLKRHTEYSADVDRNAPHIKYLWRTLEGFTQEQRRRFVKFAFAQERLPSTDEGFDGHPKIRMLIKSSRYAKSKTMNEDDAMPHADTCFFNVEIPAYSSEDLMRTRLTTLVSMDWGMSGDDIGQDQPLQSVIAPQAAPAAPARSRQERQAVPAPARARPRRERQVAPTPPPARWTPNGLGDFMPG